MMIIKKIPNQIIKQSLQPLNLSKVDSIALHHMATDNDIKSIEQSHISKGWRAIGYNFWVAFDGTIYEGRGLNLGAGVDSQNGHIISIGFQGDYHTKERKMSCEQFNSGIDIIKYVMNKVPSIKQIGGHSDFMPTSCPGKYFPLKEMKTLTKRGGENIMFYNKISDCPEWTRPYVQKAYEMGYIKGDNESNLKLTDDRIWALIVSMRINGIMD